MHDVQYVLQCNRHRQRDNACYSSCKLILPDTSVWFNPRLIRGNNLEGANLKAITVVDAAGFNELN